MSIRPFNQVDPLRADLGFKCVYGCGRAAEPGDDTCTECLLLEEEEEKALRFEDDRFAD